jgi:hypothetical protein
MRRNRRVGVNQEFVAFAEHLYGTEDRNLGTGIALENFEDLEPDVSQWVGGAGVRRERNGRGLEHARAKDERVGFVRSADGGTVCPGDAAGLRGKRCVQKQEQGEAVWDFHAARFLATTIYT